MCGVAQHTVVREGQDILFPDGMMFRALECGHCKTWFTQGSDFTTVPDYYRRSYPSAYYSVFSGGRDGDLGSNPRIARMLRALVAVERPFRVLDVGSGNGGFAHYMRQIGFDAEALELDASASSYARAHYGLRVFTGSLEQMPSGEAYDAITMVGTIEHLLNPVRTLVSARDHLATNGFLAFDFPVVDCLESRLAQARWWGLDLPRHTVHFTYRSAHAVADAAGFELVQTERVVTTWFHYGFVAPPIPNAHDRRSLPGLAYQAVAAGLLSCRRSPLGMAVYKKR